MCVFVLEIRNEVIQFSYQAGIGLAPKATERNGQQMAEFPLL